MSERAKEFYERDSVPTVTTAHTTPTERASITQIGPEDYLVTLYVMDIPPWLQRYSGNIPLDGTLTAHSRAEVARITRRLNGRMEAQGE